MQAPEDCVPDAKLIAALYQMYQSCANKDGIPLAAYISSFHVRATRCLYGLGHYSCCIQIHSGCIMSAEA